VRTTIRIDDGLFLELKTRAASSGRTLGEVIEDALRAGLARQTRDPDGTGTRLPTFAGGAPRSGVDLDDSDALLDLMEGGRR
jgi:hypothetical protein